MATDPLLQLEAEIRAYARRLLLALAPVGLVALSVLF